MNTMIENCFDTTFRANYVPLSDEKRLTIKVALETETPVYCFDKDFHEIYNEFFLGKSELFIRGKVHKIRSYTYEEFIADLEALLEDVEDEDYADIKHYVVSVITVSTRDKHPIMYVMLESPNLPGAKPFFRLDLIQPCRSRYIPD